MGKAQQAEDRKTSPQDKLLTGFRNNVMKGKAAVCDWQCAYECECVCVCLWVRAHACGPDLHALIPSWSTGLTLSVPR